MNDRLPPRRGLGRGLGSLIPTGPAPSQANEIDGAAPSAVGVIPTSRPSGSGPADAGPDPRDADWIGRVPEPTEATEPRQPEETGPELATVDGAYFAELPVTSIAPNPRQPRQVFDEDAMAELVHSIREVGLLQPVVVRWTGPEQYELVMGERRWRATQQAGLDSIPAIVRETGDDALLRDALLENLHRAQLNPLEEAAAYEQLLAEFGVTQTELADRLGRSRPVVTNTIRLLKLPVSVQRRVAAGVLSAGHARALLGCDGAERQEELAARIVAEGMSVRATEEAVVLARRDAPVAPRSARRRPMHAPGLQDLAERLSDTFDTRVKVELGQRKGRIVVEFGSVEDLERIARMMDPARNR
jgi:ParB family chromosome partitioning protein